MSDQNVYKEGLDDEPCLLDHAQRASCETLPQALCWCVTMDEYSDLDYFPE
jgi:hypothetical protein